VNDILADFRSNVSGMIKEKVSKKKLMKDQAFLMDQVRNQEFKLDGIMNGYDVIIR